MAQEDLILSALKNIQDDVREIRNTQQEQGEKISDLCTRTALNEKDINNVITEQVRKSTVKFKYLTVLFGIIASGTAVFNILKH